MFNIIKNTFKILLRRKSLLITLIIIPTALTLIFSAILGGEASYSIGVVNNDNGIVSDELIKTLNGVGSLKLVNLNEDNIDSALVGKEVEVSIEFPKDFSKNILASKNETVTLRSIGESQIKYTVSSLINDKTNNLLRLSELSKNDETQFKKLLDEYTNSNVKYSLNNVKTNKIHVINSIGIIIMMIFTSSFFITRFVIDDEKDGTKDRVLLSKVSKTKYYAGILIVFYLCSCITSILYYIICNLLKFDFGPSNSLNFLYVLFAVNFLAIAFNLAIVTVSKTPVVASNISNIVVTASCMLGGLFWPFRFMPKTLQTIGNMLPIRWPMIAFEKLDNGATFTNIMPYILYVILAGFIFLFITIIFNKKKARY